MAMCTPGCEVPDQGIVPTVLVLEQEWGEVWEADHDQLGRVLFVAYTTPAGIAMFKEAADGLKRLMDVGTHTASLIPVLKVSEDSAIPYIVTSHPGGPTLRRVAREHEVLLDAEVVVQGGIHLMEGVALAKNMNLLPVGITPDTVFCPGGAENGNWVVLPVAPGTRSQKLLSQGAYVPPEMEHGDLSLINADTYSTAWIMAELVSGEEKLRRLPEVIARTLVLDKVGEDLKAAATSGGGNYMDPGTFEMILKRYLRNEAEKEFKQFRKMNKPVGKPKKGSSSDQVPKSRVVGARTGSGKKGKKGKKKSGGGGGGNYAALFGAVLIALVKVGAIVGGAAGGYYGVRWLFTSSDTAQTPVGTARLFAGAIIEGDRAKATGFVSEDMAHRAGHFIDLLDMVARDGLANEIVSASAVTERAGAGNEYVGEAHFSDAGGTPIFVMILRLRARDDGTYEIFSVTWQGLTPTTLGL